MGQRLLFTVVAPIAARLPEPLLAVLAVAAGVLCYALRAKSRRTVTRNLQVVLSRLPPRERRKRVIAVFIHAALGYVELFKMARYDRERLCRAYTSPDWECFDEAIAHGKGVIVASAHVGPFSVAGQIFAVRGTQAAIVVERVEPSSVFERVTALRSRFGARLIPADRLAVRNILSALRSGACVGIMCDRDVTGGGEVVPFFGREARLSPAPATFALRTGAPILPVVTLRTRPFHGVVRMRPPFVLARSGDTNGDVRRGMERILRAIEPMIEAAPQQWTLFVDVWPDTPDR